MKTKPNHSSRSAFLIILIFFFLWEMMVWIKGTPPYLLPAPTQIISVLIANPSLYARATLITLSEALAGLFFGVTAGCLLASLLTLRPGMEDGVMTLAILIKSTPMVAIAPLLTLWLGFGMLPKVIITALLTFFPVLINILTGLQRTDPALVDLFRSLNASRIDTFYHLRAPYALPFLFAALKISAPLALIGAVVAEWTGASGGLGRTMWLAYHNLNLPYLFGAIFILSGIGIILYQILGWAEKRTVFWQTNTLEP